MRRSELLSVCRFLRINIHVAVTFNLQRHLISRRTLRLFRAEATEQWIGGNRGRFKRPASGLAVSLSS